MNSFMQLKEGRKENVFSNSSPLSNQTSTPIARAGGSLIFITIPTFLPISIPAEVTNSIILHEDRIGEHLLLLGVIVGHGHHTHDVTEGHGPAMVMDEQESQSTWSSIFSFSLKISITLTHLLIMENVNL